MTSVYHFELDYNNTYVANSTFITNSKLNCKKIIVVDEVVYVGCFSVTEKNIQICSYNFRKLSLIECSNKNLYFDIPDKYMDNLDLKIRYIKSVSGDVHFAILLQTKEMSDLEINFFYIISPNKSFRIDIPVDQINLKNLDFLAYNDMSKVYKIILDIENGLLSDLIIIEVEDEILNLNSLEDGIFETGILTFFKQQKTTTIASQTETSDGRILLMIIAVADVENWTDIFKID